MSKTLLLPNQLADLIEAEPVVIIDTRDPESYASDHIPGAVNIREIFTYLATTDPEGLDSLQSKFAELFGEAGLSGKETAVFYEDAMNTGFGQSCRGYFLLKSLGYEKAAVLHGGLKAWIDEGLPTTQRISVPAEATFPITTPPTSMIVTEDEMLDALDDPGVVILDVRDKDEWLGLSSSPYGVDFCPRMGRIPGAVWLEWYKMMDETADGISMFRSPEEILSACGELGISPDSKVYVYCFKGARASNTFVALQEAGIKDVKIYFGSWNEWSRNFDLPIDEEKLVAA
jgi:thiosulfate/3-mercaptopyruvate sulfurtransferase